jgi:putative signal transducing protein
VDFEELITVYTVGNPVKGEIIKNFLQSENIPCFLDGINQAAEAGLMTLEIKVQVPAPDAERARLLIEEHESRHGG